MHIPITEPLPAGSADASTRWRVGTLTCTAGGLVALFLLLLWGDFCWSMRDCYHHTFTVGCLLSLVALLAAWRVHGKFMRLGGPRGYATPL